MLEDQEKGKEVPKPDERESKWGELEGLLSMALQGRSVDRCLILCQ